MAKQLEMPYGVRVIRRVKGFLLHLFLEHIFVFSNSLRSIFSSWFSKIYLSFLKKVADGLSSSLCELQYAHAVISFPRHCRFCEFYKYLQNMVWMPSMCTMQVDTSGWKTWKKSVNPVWNGSSFCKPCEGRGNFVQVHNSKCEWALTHVLIFFLPWKCTTKGKNCSQILSSH
jgi:hypothetical protein